MGDGLLDTVLASVADSTRRAILTRLRQGEASVSQLARPAGITLTGMRKHLQVLERAGLVATRKDGRTRWVRLVPEAFDSVADFVAAYRDLHLVQANAAPFIDLSDMDVT